MIEKECFTHEIKIYLAGDINEIKKVCREYCYRVGFCVRITECLYIYTGGEEYGVEIGILNYSRFPSTKEELYEKAETLAKECRDKCYQHSYLLVTPQKTVWNSTREQ